jgi:hypothetical protein
MNVDKLDMDTIDRRISPGQSVPVGYPVLGTDCNFIDTKGLSGESAGSFKYDAGKPQMDLVPLSSVYAVAEVMTFGAKKYSPNGWKTVPDAINRYTAAMLRHMTAIQNGEVIDPDSGLPHADHVACNALFLSWLRRQELNK